MAKVNINLRGVEVEVEYDDIPAIPEDWVDLLDRLHPITACVVWEVLTNNLSTATVALAQSSPDWERYAAIRTVGRFDMLQDETAPAATETGSAHARADALHAVCLQARQELEEVFASLIPGDRRRIVH